MSRTRNSGMPGPQRMPGPQQRNGRRLMTGPQRLSGVVAVAASGFATLIALLPTWTLPAVDESDLANRVPWWDPQLVAQGNPLPAVALLAVAVGFVLVLISRMRQRPTWWPVWLFGAAIVVTVAGVFVGGAWFLVVNAVGVLFTALGMALLMVAQPKPRATRRPEPTAGDPLVMCTAPFPEGHNCPLGQPRRRVLVRPTAGH